MDITIHFDTLEKVHRVITMPFNDSEANKELISSIIHSNKSITFDEAFLHLEKYLSDESVTHDDYQSAYYKTMREINAMLKAIYNRELVETYNWPDKVYRYNPFKTYENMSISKSLKYNGKEFMNLWKNIEKFIYDSRCFMLKNLAQESYKDIIVYSTYNTSEDDIMVNLESKMFEYYATRFILIAIRNANTNNFDTFRYADTAVYIMDKLLTKDVLYNYNKLGDISMSVSKSISWDSYGGEEFQSEAKKEGNVKTREELAKFISDKNENDADVFSGEKWEDMSLYKLKHVISLPNVINREGKTSKVLYYAFYVRTLYQAWRYAVKNKLEFTNPYNRKVFTEEDKQIILHAMVKLFPNIKAPVNSGRNDIRFTNIYVDNINNLYFDYILKRPKHEDINIRILHLRISIPERYAASQMVMMDNIEKLLQQNKLFGRNIPLKIMEIFEYYHYSNSPMNSDEYARFYNAIM